MGIIYTNVCCFDFSIVVLFGAGNGSWQPFALSQLLKILFGLGIFFLVSFSNIKTWIKSAYVIYAIALILVIMVTFVGDVGMGHNVGFRLVL